MSRPDDPQQTPLKIAVIGAGVSGLVAAVELSARHDVVLYEAAGRLGGHAHTVEVEHEGRRVPVDTGFMVYNETTYPELTRLFARLGVASRPSDMSFSVRNEASGLEYCGTSLATLFAQRRNLARPAFLRMLAEIVRFNRQAPELADAHPEMTLAELLEVGGFGRFFRDHYLVPMTAAVWSATAERALEMPASFLVRFYRNHGMLSVDDHLPWRTVVGGSVRYVEALALEGRSRGMEVLTGTPVDRIERLDGAGVRVVAGDSTGSGPSRVVDRVVLAVHADRALALLAEPTAAERSVLGAFPVPAQRGRAAHRRVDPAAPAAGAGELELPRDRRRAPAGRGDRGDPDLRPVPSPGASRSGAAAADARPDGADRPAAGCSARSPGSIRSTPWPGSPPRHGARRSAAPTGSTTAARTGATASTRTAWSSGRAVVREIEAAAGVAGRRRRAGRSRSMRGWAASGRPSGRRGSR